ncbi:C_GCAxxG_C_C family protein [Clostridiales Family XIII bacterium RF-744-FAT-WT-3]|uniref:C_GCAxxG_C_C family protein n=1 Tax=Baileyella intestinalis TaxID=2606709 RepID=A0A6A8M6N9_9FIRM|nr:C-GCAxxG-C-C family protein [Baileyella intestinalis]MST68493.1 C_GCAxxG_C_C family protein [Baileyella intestinalis]
MTNQERAARLHGNGYNCCQAVLLTFCDELGVDPVTAFKIGEGFGLGMGGMENTCGALSGAIMLAGLKNSDGDLDHPKTKAGTYRISRELTEAFKEKTGALVCRDLKGIDTGKVLCSCPKCIDSAVQIVEEILGL